jgi:hypothetical protein
MTAYFRCIFLFFSEKSPEAKDYGNYYCIAKKSQISPMLKIIIKFWDNEVVSQVETKALEDPCDLSNTRT